MRVRRLGIWTTLAALAFAGPAAPAASALEPGVHVDPGSPAAKEYALPLNQARGTATGGSGASSQGSSEGEAGLFGAGIKPPRSGSGGGSGSAARHRAARSPSVPAADSGGSSGEAVLGRLALHSTGGGGISGSTLALIAGGVAILVLGGFGGTVLRHNRRPSS